MRATPPKDAVRQGDTAPDFTAESTQGKIKFYNWAGPNWVLLYVYNRDFQPVCTTEMADLAKKMGEFKKRGTKVLALSKSTLEDHVKWVKEIESSQKVKITFPIIADPSCAVLGLFEKTPPTSPSQDPAT